MLMFQAFSDSPLRARIMLLLGKLSFEEAQYGQAINFCKKAQVGGAKEGGIFLPFDLYEYHMDLSNESC